MTIFRAGATPAVGLVSWTTQTSQGNPVVMAGQNHMAPWNETPAKCHGMGSISDETWTYWTWNIWNILQ